MKIFNSLCQYKGLFLSGLFFGLLWPCSAVAQSSLLDLELPKVVPPSPTARALHADIFYPVDGNTGTPDITIPIYEIVSGNITVPIVLRYHTSNLKLNGSVHCNVAHGWTLEYGGMVSRTINNKPDELAVMASMTNGKLYNQYTSNADQEEISKMYSWTGLGGLDTEYDHFTYNFPGASGSFFLQRDNPQQLSSPFKALFSPIKPYKLDSLTLSSTMSYMNKFIVRDDTGLSFYFGGVQQSDNKIEFASDNAGNTSSSGWMLAKIREDNGNNVTFSYTPVILPVNMDTYWYYLTDMPHGYLNSFLVDPLIMNYQVQYLVSPNTWPSAAYSSLMPAEIVFAHGKVVFTLETNKFTVKEVTVYDKSNQQVRKVTFNKTNGAITGNTLLSSVSIKGADNVEIDKYTLNYHNLFTGYSSYDYWGYCNGSSIGGFMPMPYKSFSITDQNSTRTVNFGYNVNRTPNSTQIKNDLLDKITYLSGGSTVFEFEPNNFSYERQTAVTLQDGSGLRIKSITHKDTDASILQSFKYNYGPGRIPIRPNQDNYNIISYRLLTLLIDLSTWLGIETIFGDRHRMVTPRWVSYVGMAGERVTYDWMEEVIVVSSGTAGKTVSYFDAPTAVTFTPNFANSSEISYNHSDLFYHLSESGVSWVEPKLQRKEIFNGSNTMLQKITYQYASTTPILLLNMGFHKYSTWDTSLFSPNYSKLFDYQIFNHLVNNGNLPSTELIPPLLYFYYTQSIGGRYLTKITTEHYYGAEVLTEELSYTYTSPHFYYPSAVTRLMSDGGSDITRFKYPFDYTLGGNPVAYEMAQRNIIAPIMEQKRYYKSIGGVETLLETYDMSYGNKGTTPAPMYRPSLLKYNTRSNTAETRLQYTQYDPKGNLRSLTQNVDIHTSYLWGYGYLYPIAQVTGPTWSELSTALGGTLETVSANINPTDVSITGLLSNARSLTDVLVSGFLYKPLYGVKQTVAPHAQNTFYNYDPGARLSTIFDLNNRLVAQYQYGIGTTQGATYIKAAQPDSSVTTLSALVTANQRWTNTYYDGIFRPVQTVESYGSTTGKDQIMYTQYDLAGRKSKDALVFPLTVGSGNWYSAAVTAQSTWYNTLYSGEGSFASSRYTWESSPLGRLTEQYLPGGGQYAVPGGATIRYDYQTNTVSDVKLWTVSSSGAPSFTIYYPKNTLFKNVVTDPDGRISVSYTDKSGRVIETRIYKSGVQPLTTSYVYNDMGLLCCVIPPKAQLSSPPAATDCYIYKYDHRNRMIEKSIPGGGITSYVYDANDRLIASQDANQAAAVSKRWSFTRYDRLGREVYRGTVANSSTPANLRTAYQTVAYPEKLISGGAINDYSNTAQTLSITINDVLSTTWYDRYSYSAPLSFTAMGAEVGQATTSVYLTTPLGLPTGSRVKVLDGNEYTSNAVWLKTSSYYDAKGQMIQEVAQRYNGTTTPATNRTGILYR
ncbi:MAG: DUF6443 domain-containing protein, partial [Bacteroidales bacterium]|nr:DUF6443 domain-containing protein [Bacteroidales bacterium]